MIVVSCGVVREVLEIISDDVITAVLEELTEGETASKGSQFLACINAVRSCALSFDSVQKCRRRSSDRPAGLCKVLLILFYLNEQLQTLPNIFCMNVSKILFRKTKLHHNQGYFLTYFIVRF